MEYPENDEIEPEKAKFLYEQHCAILVIEGLPIGSECGIDLAAFRVGEKFKGVKLIPPGVHFVFASAVDNKRGLSQCGPRCGFYYNFSPKELLIKRWSEEHEEFDDDSRGQSDIEQRNRYLANLRDLDAYLGAYRYSTYKAFLAITNKMTPALVNSLVPVCKKIRSVPYLVRHDQSGRRTDPSSPQPMVSGLKQVQRKRRFARSKLLCPETAEGSLLPHLQPAQDSLIQFTSIPDDHIDCKQFVALNEITEYYLDSTKKLESAYPHDSDRQFLLGEFQFAFVTLILGHVYECFEHWRILIHLVCHANSALQSYPSLFALFAQTLKNQLEHVPEDLFEDIADSDNLIRNHINTLLENVAALENSDNELMYQVGELRTCAETKFGWQFNLDEVELLDEQPVIVDL